MTVPDLRNWPAEYKSLDRFNFVPNEAHEEPAGRSPDVSPVRPRSYSQGSKSPESSWHPPKRPPLALNLFVDDDYLDS